MDIPAYYGRHLPKGDTVKIRLLLTLSFALSLTALAQTNPKPTIVVDPQATPPTFRVNLTTRNAQAVNYRHRSGSTKVDFVGTDLMPAAKGEAEVESKR